MLHGTPASEGIGLGRVMIVEEAKLEYNNVTVTDTEAEVNIIYLNHLITTKKAGDAKVLPLRLSGLLYYLIKSFPVMSAG